MKHTRFKAFVKKHNTRLVVLGWFIVLATFVARDIVGEHYKAQRDSLAEAQSEFRVRNEFVKVSDSISSTYYQVRNRSQSRSRGAEDQISEDELMLADSCNGLYAAVENSEELAHRISLSLDVQQKFIDAKKLTASACENASPTLPDGDPDYSNEAAAIVRKETSEAHRLLDKLTNNEAFKLLRLAGSEEEVRQKRYDVVSYVSYGFFFLGSVMSLLGRLLGIEIVSDS